MPTLVGGLAPSCPTSGPININNCQPLKKLSFTSASSNSEPPDSPYDGHACKYINLLPFSLLKMKFHATKND